MNNRVFSIIGLFEHPEQLLKAIPSMKSRTGAHLEAYTPYPVEGVPELLGLRKSPIGGMVLVMGVIGALSAIAFELWANGIDYPLITAGKPPLSWEAFIPIMFEVTVLFATFTAGLGMLLLLNRLPLFRSPMLRSKSMARITRDKFALAVESRGSELNVEEISDLFSKVGAMQIEVVEEPEPLGPASPKFFFYAFAAIAISCVIAGFLTYWALKLFPVAPPMSHMLVQPRLDPQKADSYFKDDFGMRMPVSGTVSRSSIPYSIRVQADASNLPDPYPRTAEVMGLGRKAFNSYCAVCHGLLGDGHPTLTAAYGARPANLISQQVRDLPDGQIYHVIRMGRNAMPSYSADMAEKERWAAVQYIRVLQRSMNAKDEDLK
jgi:mono/diheme cytochrome c family protein